MVNKKEAKRILNQAIGRYRESGSELLIKCPSCDHHKYKLSINLNKNAFKCWVCDYRGRNIRRLIRRFGTFTQLQKWDEITNRFDIERFSELFSEEPIEEAKVAKLEPLPTPKQKSKVNEFQKNGNTAKETLWEKMVRKVETKKSNSKTLEENPHKKVVVAKKMNSIKSKTRRSRSSNLAPISGLRPFEGGGSSIQRRSFR